MSSRQSLPVTATVAAVLIAVAVMGSAPSGPTVIFVDDDNCPGPGSGTEGDPFCSIQDAIDAAVNGDEVVVGAGTYFETIDVLGKAITVRSSVGPGVTTIDGTGLNDSVVKCISGEGPGTVLEGFTVTGGTGTVFPFVGVIGGGMFNHNSSPTITNIIFNGNTAEDGGGMANFGGSPAVTNCTFSGNSVNSFFGVARGGGMFNRFSTPTVTNCTFTGNTANLDGGGMFNFASNPVVAACIFIGNSATTGSGGGMTNKVNSTPTVIGCSFSVNSANVNGGGMFNFDSSPTVINSTFSGNTGFIGGGMTNFVGSSPMVTNCTFSGNSALFHGGGMFNLQSSPTVTNSTFDVNSADFAGGGMINFDASDAEVTNCTFSANTAVGAAGMANVESSPTVTNCTFSGNNAQDGGGGMFNQVSNPTVTNCILWGNSPDQFFDIGSTATVSYSDVLGGRVGVGNIDADPMFVDAANGDFRLLAGSPCIDSADSTAVPSDTADLDNDGDTVEPTPWDLDGNPRFVNDPATADTGNGDCAVDMGAYEFQLGAVVCCPGNLNGNGGAKVANLLALLAAWGTNPGGPPDSDGDGAVAVPDLLRLLADWVPCQ